MLKIFFSFEKQSQQQYIRYSCLWFSSLLFSSSSSSQLKRQVVHSNLFWYFTFESHQQTSTKNNNNWNVFCNSILTIYRQNVLSVQLIRYRRTGIIISWELTTCWQVICSCPASSMNGFQYLFNHFKSAFRS